MKKISFLTIILFATNILFAQEDSVNMTGNYALDVFYSLDNGSVQTVANAEWTIAFSTGAQTSQVLINDGRGVELYEISTNVSDFASINASDTNGMATSWTKLHNDFQDWEHSAYETGATGHPNYGWGTYTGSPNHNILGEKIFIIKTLEHKCFKTMIVKKHLGEWTYRYATLDNSFDTTIVYQASDLQDRNFVYLNMDNNTILNREPSNTEWDLLFTKYYSVEANYPVMGVLSNFDVEVLQIDGVVNNTSATYVGGTFHEQTNKIGYDWKIFTSVYTLVNDKIYFVKQKNGTIYKLFFTRFDGSSTGKIVFNKEEVGSVSITNQTNNFDLISIFPNPTKDITHIALNSNSETVGELEIYNVVGKQINKKTINISSGLNNISVNVKNFSEGIYFIKLHFNTTIKTFKIVVKK